MQVDKVEAHVNADPFEYGQHCHGIDGRDDVREDQALDRVQRGRKSAYESEIVGEVKTVSDKEYGEHGSNDGEEDDGWRSVEEIFVVKLVSRNKDDWRQENVEKERTYMSCESSMP